MEELNKLEKSTNIKRNQNQIDSLLDETRLKEKGAEIHCDRVKIERNLPLDKKSRMQDGITTQNGLGKRLMIICIAMLVIVLVFILYLNRIVGGFNDN